MVQCPECGEEIDDEAKEWDCPFCGYGDYDVWGGDHPEMSERYRVHAHGVKKFNYDDLQFISDVKR